MASDYHLKIDGIPGESQDSKHKEEIQIESFSWGATQTGIHAGGGGGGAGKVSFQDAHFTHKADKASPLLMLNCAEGKHIAKAVLTVRKAGGKQEAYYVITMSDLLVSSFQSSGQSAGDSVPSESFSLNFTKVEFEYKPQDNKGALGAPVKSGWNVKKNEKV